MTELPKDLEKSLRDFLQICNKFNDNERNNKELSILLNNLKISNEMLKDNEKKSVEQMKTLRQICNEQANSIAGLYDIEKKIGILTEENNGLIHLIKTLKDKIDVIETNNNKTIQDYIYRHKIELKDKEEQFNKRERELQERNEVLQASFDLEIYEKNNEIENLKTNFDEQLNQATSNEQTLKNEIFKLNNQCSSSTAVLQKKILELEQKLKSSEREKSMYNISQGNFVSANNVFKSYSNFNQTSRNENTLKNQTQNKNPPSIIRNVAQSIESNTSKKFMFRKTNRSNENIDKKLLSESFNPFENSEQMNANKQPWKQNNNSSREVTVNSISRDVTCDIIEENSENSNNSLQECKMEESGRFEIENNVQIVQQSQKNIQQENEQNIELQSRKNVVGQTEKNLTKYISPTGTKKRRMFDPKNIDYLT